MENGSSGPGTPSFDVSRVEQQATQEQAETLQTEALNTGSGEVAQSIGSEERTIETEFGEVKWDEPKAYLPKSRKVFFPSVEGPRTGS